MIKLSTLYNEIKVFSKDNYFPKDKEWKYKVTTKEQGIKLLKKLNVLGYVWGDGSEINSEGNYPNNIFDDLNKPIYISKINDRRGITWSSDDNMDEFFTTPNPLKLNY